MFHVNLTDHHALQSNRFGLSRSKDAKKAAANAADAEPATPDFSAKLLHLAWHPEAPLIAAAGDCARLCRPRLSRGTPHAVGTNDSCISVWTDCTICKCHPAVRAIRSLLMCSCLPSCVLGSAASNSLYVYTAPPKA